MTRILRKTIVLGLAGLGIYKAWEIANANLGITGEGATRLKRRLEPTVRQAETDVKDATRDAVETVLDASHDAAETVLDASRVAVASVAEAVADVAMGSPAAATKSSAGPPAHTV